MFAAVVEEEKCFPRRACSSSPDRVCGGLIYDSVIQWSEGITVLFGVKHVLLRFRRGSVPPFHLLLWDPVLFISGTGRDKKTMRSLNMLQYTKRTLLAPTCSLLLLRIFSQGSLRKTRPAYFYPNAYT